MAFTEEEAAYLRSQPLARIATVGPDGQPDVAPVGFEFDGTHLYVGGRAPERTRKFLNVKAGQARAGPSTAGSRQRGRGVGFFAQNYPERSGRVPRHRLCAPASPVPPPALTPTRRKNAQLRAVGTDRG